MEKQAPASPSLTDQPSLPNIKSRMAPHPVPECWHAQNNITPSATTPRMSSPRMTPCLNGITFENRSGVQSGRDPVRTSLAATTSCLLHWSRHETRIGRITPYPTMPHHPSMSPQQSSAVAAAICISSCNSVALSKEKTLCIELPTHSHSTKDRWHTVAFQATSDSRHTEPNMSDCFE